MFKGKKSKIDPNTTDTLIGEGTLFEGKIRSEAGIRVEGRIIGDIESSGDVTVGEHGEARSNITARNVVLAGQVHGNVVVSGKLTIRETGRLHGNMTARELNIESGGIFQGSSKMVFEEGAASAAPDPQQESAEKPSTANEPQVLNTW